MPPLLRSCQVGYKCPRYPFHHTVVEPVGGEEQLYLPDTCRQGIDRPADNDDTFPSHPVR
jgi:hypothetical protein